MGLMLGQTRAVSGGVKPDALGQLAGHASV